MATATRSVPEPRLPVACADHRAASVRLHDGTPVDLALSEPGPAIGERTELVARAASGDVVGRAAYHRVYGPRAELSVAVDDGFWHRGLPSLLIGSLRERAATGGISTFLMTARASDLRLLALLYGDFGARCTRDGAVVVIELACDMAARRGGDPHAPAEPGFVTARFAADRD